MPLGKSGQALGLLERMEVLAVEVLDQRDLEDLGIRDLDLDAGDLRQPRLERRAEAPLAGDDPKAAVRQGADEERLQHPFGLDRLDQLPEVSHARARLLRVRFDVLDRDEPAECLAEPLRERLDEVRVVAHPCFRGKAPSSTRHAREPPRKGSNTRPRRSSAARK